jgi:hypothetical protein
MPIGLLKRQAHLAHPGSDFHVHGAAEPKKFLSQTGSVILFALSATPNEKSVC